MNPITAWRAATVTTKAIIVLSLVVLIAGAIALHHWRSKGAATAQASVAQGQLGAATASGHDAAETISNTAQAAQATDELTRNNADAIEQAPGSNVAVDPGVQRAGINALCSRRAYRDTPACRRP